MAKKNWMRERKLGGSFFDENQMTNAVSSCLVTWSCVINAKLTTMDLVSIETVNCALAFFLCAELTETHS